MFGGPEIGGVDVDVVKILAQKFGFTFKTIMEPTVGKRIPNSKEWLGVVGAVSLTSNILLKILHNQSSKTG